MSRIRDRDTVPELLLRRAVWRLGLRYSLKSKLPGRPDLVFSRLQLLVFVDGCFWHGCPEHFVAPKTRSQYWSPKIAGNVARDLRHNETLRAAGWTVLRFWEHEIEQNAEACARKVASTLRQLQRRQPAGGRASLKGEAS